MNHGFWDLNFKDLVDIAILLLTAWAIWYGPIKAVKITRAADERRALRDRRYWVFRELMRTRMVVLSPEHVLALNLVQLEFYGNDEVQEAYRTYVASLNDRSGTTNEEATEKLARRRDLLFDLLHSMGKVLGLSYDKRDLDKLSYSPQGWQNDENTTRTLREYALEVMTGKRAVHFAPFGGVDPRYPPRPEVEQPKK